MRDIWVIFAGVVLAEIFMMSLRWFLHRIALRNANETLHYKSLGRLSQEDIRIATGDSQSVRDHSAN